MRMTLGPLLSVSIALLALVPAGCGESDEAATCFDGLLNGEEQGVDCGASCGVGCGNGTVCTVAADCQSGSCDPVSRTCTNPVVFADLAFTVVSGVVPSEWAGHEDARTLLKSAAEFQALLGVAAPTEIDFDTQWVLYHSAGSLAVPGHRVSIDRIEAASDGSELRLQTTLFQPGAACETFQTTRPTWTLVRFDQLAGAQTLLIETRTPSPLDCTNGAADSASCSPEQPCGPGLLCGGIIASGSGMCMPADQAGVFGEAATVAIPDDDTLALTRTLEVSGLATVDVDVVATIELTHDAPEELWIGLTNPSGNQTLVWDHEPGPGGAMVIVRVPRGLSGDESVNGTWTLTLRDDVPGDAGQLTAWSVEILSRYD